MIDYVQPKVIAEIGCNHMGSFNNALDMAKEAIECGAWGVKLQKRDVKGGLTPEQYNRPYENEWSLGKTYGEHRENLEFNTAQHLKLRDALEGEAKYGCSVWDTKSALDIISIKPDFIKIPAQCNTNWEMLETVLERYVGDIHISLGMTEATEELEIESMVCAKGRQKDVVMYHCTSIYPCPFEYSYLLNINQNYYYYKEQLGYKSIGFSNHCNGIAIDLAAYALGAEYFERHFTLNRAWKGTDQAWSLEPQGLKKLVRDLNNTYKGMKGKIEMPEAEYESRRKFGKGN